MSNPLETLKETECSCKRCRAMCKRPCFGTPEDIQKIIDAGFGDRLMLDHHCGIDPDNDVSLLCPALKGSESKNAPFVPSSEQGCTFWKYGKCELHKLKLKPIVGRLAHHGNPNDPVGAENTLSDYVSEMWNTAEGKRLVSSWCAEHEVPEEHVEPTVLDAIELMSKYYNLN